MSRKKVRLNLFRIFQISIHWLNSMPLDSSLASLKVQMQLKLYMQFGDSTDLSYNTIILLNG